MLVLYFNYDPNVDWKDKFNNAGFLRGVVALETGGGGTRHLQGYIENRHLVKKSNVKTVLPSAHWEAASDDDYTYKNHEYCSKECNYFSQGDWSSILASRGNRVPKISPRLVLARLLTSSDQDIRNEGTYIYRKTIRRATVGAL